MPVTWDQFQGWLGSVGIVNTDRNSRPVDGKVANDALVNRTIFGPVPGVVVTPTNRAFGPVGVFTPDRF